MAIDVALTVSDEISAQATEADRIRAAHVQRARHEAEQARRRYLAVDPTNRLVADALEADWNNRLRDLAGAQDEYDKTSSRAEEELDQARRDRIRALATDFPALWHNPATPIRERKRLIRLLVTDVTLLRTDEHIVVSVRFPAGQHHTVRLPPPRTAWQLHTTPDATIATIDELLNTHPFDETVTILNQRGLTGGWGKPFTVASLAALCRTRNIPSHADRLRTAGMLTLNEIADELSVTTTTAKRWHRLGLITGHRIDGRGEHLYEPHQPRPAKADIVASQRTDGTTQLVTGFQLADRLSVSPSTVYSWFKAGLTKAHAVDQRGFNLYHPDQARPTKTEITASQRPTGTADLVTGGQLAARLGCSRSAIYKWYQLGLVQAEGTDKTGRHLYQPDLQPPSPAQIRQARAAARQRQPQLSSSDGSAPRATS